MVADERTRPDVARKRVRWQKYQARVDPTRLVFIDETWAKTNMAPLRGWAPKGVRLPGAAPFGHWNTKHLGHAVAARKRAGLDCSPGLLSHTSPLGWAHILLTGEYRWKNQ